MSGRPSARRRTIIRGAALTPVAGLGLAACGPDGGTSATATPTAPVDLGPESAVAEGGAKLFRDHNVVVSRAGDLYVAEDGGNMEINLITPDRVVSPFLRYTGNDESEITGPVFDPSGTRLYFSSQRGPAPVGPGITFEVRGPFRVSAIDASAPPRLVDVDHVDHPGQPRRGTGAGAPTSAATANSKRSRGSESQAHAASAACQAAGGGQETSGLAAA